MFNFFKRNKKSYKVSIANNQENFIVEYGETLLSAALRNGINWPKKCQVGSCGTCRCKIISGNIRPEIDFAYVLEADEINDGFALACQTTLKSDVSVDVKLLD
jgi:ferredoxin|tara:strand:+ start:573 stop:881 length:309 start_codon:yes stop_codon:yes gene_type:complete